ncbi:MAG: SEL1-like repeat protein [Gammaproteobacteria bacterium]|nr:SEL1-like repeat protein [Gammaproteobacteria bacterium]
MNREEQKEEADRTFSIGGYEAASERLKTYALRVNAYAQLYLGHMYGEGNGVEQDNKMALAWYMLADTHGNLPEAQYRLGVICEVGELGVSPDFQVAAKWYRRAAEQGFALAQFKLGGLYNFGRGVPEDFEEAVRWYKPAADQGLSFAQVNLGCMYEAGQGVPKNLQEAAKWHRLAAEQGRPSAQFMLAVKYRFGVGVNQNYVQAHMWANLAAANRHANGDDQSTAIELRDAVAQKMSPNQIAEAQRLAREFSARYPDE